MATKRAGCLARCSRLRTLSLRRSTNTKRPSSIGGLPLCSRQEDRLGSTSTHTLRSPDSGIRAGDDDIDDAGKALAGILRTDAPKGLTWYYEPRPDLKHGTIYKG